jgi:hypothetical protein
MSVCDQRLNCEPQFNSDSKLKRYLNRERMVPETRGHALTHLPGHRFVPIAVSILSLTENDVGRTNMPDKFQYICGCPNFVGAV